MHFLRTNAVMTEKYYTCLNGHQVHHSNDYSAVLSVGVYEYESIVQWVSTETQHAKARCEICGSTAGVKQRFRHGPPLLVFSIPDSRIRIDNTFDISTGNHCHTYILVAVIYYGSQHFTSQLVTRDGRLWFYDGITIADPSIEPTLELVGSIQSQPSMNMCEGRRACAIIYARL